MRIYTVFIFIVLSSSFSNAQRDYMKYHKKVNKVNTLIASKTYEKALLEYNKLFKTYDFIFVRDYKVAAQLALQIGDTLKTLELISKGIKTGWSWKDIKKHSFLKPLQTHKKWSSLKKEYDQINQTYLDKLDTPLQTEVHDMFKKDQLKALGALFRIGNNAQIRHANRKFAPHSERQMIKVIQILREKSYAGEQLIGNNYWMSTIISHHNSISTEYAKKDTLYNFIKPMLLNDVKSGHLSPSEFAVMDDWRIATLNRPDKIGYGFLTSVKSSTLEKTDSLRTSIGLPSVGLRNKLAKIEKETGINLYLTDWLKGEIKIEDN